MKYTVFGLMFLVLAVLGGCNGDDKLIEASYQVADALISQLPQPEADDPPILSASFANIDDLERSSTLGRLISEYIASRFVLRGYNVAELKIRDSVYVKKQSGQFLLSRDLSHLNLEYETNALIVGTYSVGADTVYVSAKVVSPTDSKIIATHDFSIHIDSNVAKMLSGR